MKNNNTHDLIIRGVHMELTDALKNIVEEKASRLFRHEDRIVRLRIDLEHDKTSGKEKEFIAKGEIAISGPNINVSVATEDGMKSIDMLIDKLDRQLRRRSRLRKEKRNHPHGVEIPASLPKA